MIKFKSWLGVALILFAISASAGEQAWVTRSDANTRLLIELKAEFVPEGASIQGLAQYDGKAMDIGPRIVTRRTAAAEALIVEYERRLAIETDTRVRQDLQILIDKLQRDIEGAKLAEQWLLDWMDLPGTIFQVTALLLSDQVVPVRREKVVELLQRYTGVYPGTTSVFLQARNRFNDSLGDGKIGPYGGQVEDAITRYPTYAQGIPALFARYELQDGDAARAARPFSCSDWTARRPGDGQRHSQKRSCGSGRANPG